MARQFTIITLRDDAQEPESNNLRRFFRSSQYDMKPDAIGVTVSPKDKEKAHLFTVVPWGNILGACGAESDAKGGNK